MVISSRTADLFGRTGGGVVLLRAAVTAAGLITGFDGGLGPLAGCENRTEDGDRYSWAVSQTTSSTGTTTGLFTAPTAVIVTEAE